MMNTESSPSSLLYDIQLTPYGGRGAFARELIPKDAVVLSCSEPYASIVFRPFKREVCAWCFAYAFESGRSKWSVTLGRGSEDDRFAGEAAGAWFCSEKCRDGWVREHELVAGEGVGWWLEVNGMLDRLIAQKGKSGTRNKKGKNAGRGRDFAAIRLSFLDDLAKEQVTQDLVDNAWSLAEEVSFEESTKFPNIEWVRALNEFELDTARFLLDGLVRKIVEDSRVPSISPTINGTGYAMGAGLWTDYLELQNNELAYVHSKPYALASYIHIYRFLKQLVNSQIPSPPHSRSRETVQPVSATQNVIPEAVPMQPIDMLRTYLSNSEVVRALLVRDPGNVFGIWDTAPDDQGSEMLGWGAYVFGSYFNHDCDPNIKKHRDGRGIGFYTTRDIHPGEELCISYIDGASVGERNAHLERDWFFTCRCAKCVRELALETGV